MADAPAGIVKVTDWRALRKVVFYDNDYKCSYVNNSAELAIIPVSLLVEKQTTDI